VGFRHAATRVHDERGTASVEFVAVVPALICALLVAAQVAVIGHAFWSAGVAARAGARAALVDRSASRAALRALPRALRPGASVDEDYGVSVRVALPRVLPLVPEIAVSASAALEEDG
jgi:Flp pilus assembly protein TadG